MLDVPVVFIHIGESPGYLLNSINQSLFYRNKVYLITDKVPHNVGAIIENIKELNQDEPLFKANYKHMSTNSYEFEFLCIYRWFLLRNFMVRNNLKKVLYLDSDVYLFGNANEINLFYSPFEFAYNVPEKQDNYYMAGSACCSFWSMDSISEFCDFILSYYTTNLIKVLQEKWDFHMKKNVLGGICDMTFLYLFSNQHKGFLNLGKVYNNASFDFNNLISSNYFENEYEYKRSNKFKVNTKAIKFKNGIPYSKNNLTGNCVRFWALTEYAKLVSMKVKLSPFQKLKKFIIFKK